MAGEKREPLMKGSCRLSGWHVSLLKSAVAGTGGLPTPSDRGSTVTSAQQENSIFQAS